MISIVYQRNDEIPIHINCQVSTYDAEKESALAKKFKKIALPHAQRRKRTLVLNSGLTVSSTDQHQHSSRSSHAISKPLSGSKDQNRLQETEADLALQDIFLPSSSSTALHHPTSSSKPSTGAAGTTTTAKTATSGEGSEGQVEADSTKHVRGREVFGFQTGRKKTAGLKALIEAQLPRKDDTPTKDSGKGKSSAATSASAAANSKNKTSVSDRMAKRRRIAGTISKMNKVTSSDEGEDEEDESDESDAEEEDEDDEMNGTVARDAAQAHKKSIFEEDEMGAERYFQDLYQKSQTSNNTLSSLPTLERADYTMAMKQAPVKHAQEKEMLNMLYEEQFQQWYFELRSGFNLLVYGYGSKRLLLTKFATTILTDAPLLIVNGYFPTLTIKDILDRISSKALKYTGPTGALSEQLAFIHAYFRQPDRAVEKIYLLIHNIDGPSLRSEKVQSALSVLASCPSIHLIASVDHINANILWDAVKAARFRWVWHELTTFSPYTAETSYENSIMVQQQDLGPRGIQYVLASLTSNGKGLFRILAEHQIQAELEGVEAGTSISGKTDYGMPYNALFKKCQENFLVSNAVTFKTQLTEFRDHRIVQSRKGGDGVEILTIPLSASVLEGVLEQMS